MKEFILNLFIFFPVSEPPHTPVAHQSSYSQNKSSQTKDYDVGIIHIAPEFLKLSTMP